MCTVKLGFQFLRQTPLTHHAHRLQMVTAIVVLYLAKLCRIITFPDIGRDIPRKVILSL